jgi:hypothetical protein
MLLPLLWSGEINVGSHDLKLGKIIIVLAGSDPRLPESMKIAKSMDPNLGPNSFHLPKVVDLLSRINGGMVSIPAFYDRSQNLDRRADKICAAAHLLRQRFGSELRTVPYGLLRFIYDTEFRYGVRSINHLIDLVPFQGQTNNTLKYRGDAMMATADALASSSLAYHLIEQNRDPAAVVESWQKAHGIEVQMPLYNNESDAIPNWVSADIGRDFINHMYREFQGDD